MRTAGSKNKNTIEFVRLYDQLAKKYVDPLEVMFKILKGRYKPEHKISAARTLLPFRFSKPQAEEIGEQGELRLVWDKDAIPEDIEKAAQADG